MSSSLGSACFVVSISGQWRSVAEAASSPPDPAAVARADLRSRAAALLNRHTVLRRAAAQDALNADLGQWLRPAPGVEAAGRATLTVSRRDRRLAEEHARRLRQLDLDHAAQLHELRHLQHILADADLRQVWWLSQFPHSHGELQALTNALSHLARPGQEGEDHVALRQFADRLISVLDAPEQRQLFLRAITQTFQALGHTELAQATSDWQERPEREDAP